MSPNGPLNDSTISSSKVFSELSASLAILSSRKVLKMVLVTKDPIIMVRQIRISSIPIPDPSYKRERYEINFDELDKIGICGDWCLGKNVLDGAISGTMLAEEIVSSTIK